jgi:CHAT domain-containing protein
MRALLIITLLGFTQFLMGIPQDEKNDLFVEKANHFYEQLSYDSAIFYYSEAISKTNQKDAPELFGYLLNREASSLFWADRMHETEIASRRSLKYCRDTLGSMHPETAQAHINLGTFKFLAGNYGVVAEHFYEAAFILENYYGKEHPKVAKAYEWLGTMYESQSDTAIARNYLWKSLGIYQKSLGADHPDIAELYRYIGLYYKRFGPLDSAIFYFEKAKWLFDQKYGEANFQSVKCLNNISDAYSNGLGQWDKVPAMYDACMKLVSGFTSPNRHTTAMTLYRMYDLHCHRQNYLLAIGYLNKILQLYYPEFKNKNIFENPALVTSCPYTIPKIVLIAKARELVSQAEKDIANRGKYLAAASECYVFLDQIMDVLCQSMQRLDDRLSFANGHASLYYEMARLEFELYQSGFGDECINKALYYSEKKKLNEDIRKFADHPGFLYPKDYKLLGEIIQKNKVVNELKSQRISSNDKEKFDRQIVSKTLEADAKYAELIVNKAIPSTDFRRSELTIAALQDRLQADECLLYFAEITQDYKQIPYALLVIAINKEQVKTIEIEGQETFHLISDYCQRLASNQPVDSTLAAGTKLYEKLISPFAEILKFKIILYPSAFLSQLPFEALPDLSHNDHRMLIENHLIWKIFSLNDLYEKSALPIISHDSLLAVAPAFNSAKAEEIALLTHRDINLINLAGAAKECSMIAGYFNTFLLDGLTAGKEQFKQLCTRFPYIHISTHGAPVDGETEIVQLAFSNRGENDNGWLNFYEILNLDIRADLVVLSACKTGVGMKNNGEGSLNLGWAFRQAGAQSVIISLWDVSDYASAEIMPAFYKFLKKGHSKPEALRLAKLSFINDHDQIAASPFYWAAFDFVGNGNSSTGKSSLMNNLQGLLISVIILSAVLLAGLVWWRKRKLSK